METTTLLIWGTLFGSIGFGFFLYGKKQKKAVPLISGIALMLFPYFMPNAIMLVIVGIVLVALPYFIRL